MLAQRVEFPAELPDSLTGSWTAIQNTVYMLTILFGALSLPKVTMYGVWQGKGGQEWHEEIIELDCRSPKVRPLIERDQNIIQKEINS